MCNQRNGAIKELVKICKRVMKLFKKTKFAQHPPITYPCFCNWEDKINEISIFQEKQRKKYLHV